MLVCEAREKERIEIFKLIRVGKGFPGKPIRETYYIAATGPDLLSSVVMQKCGA
jgi:hypothetical protein